MKMAMAIWCRMVPSCNDIHVHRKPVVTALINDKGMKPVSAVSCDNPCAHLFVTAVLLVQFIKLS